MKPLIFLLTLSLLGCSTEGQIKNAPLDGGQEAVLTDGSLFSVARHLDGEGVNLFLAFSGGGTRASALAYGVLEELRDTKVLVRGRSVRLLDEVDFISAVSGGSFTAAYYGLYRDRIFTDYKEEMLTRDLSDRILQSVFNPLRWFSTLGRTDLAENIYAESGFGNATFEDMQRNGPPAIAINATDLSQGIRFTFLQDYFNLICSDLSTFPVARAVTASSAVPILFDPVVIKNYSTCSPKDIDDYIQPRAEKRSVTLRDAAHAALSYKDKQERPFVHLVDGGISDNLGLRLLLDTVEFAGGMNEYLAIAHNGDSYIPARHFAIIVVNASVKEDSDIDKVSSPPTIIKTINSVTDAQLHLYNNETLELTGSLLKEWSKAVSTPDRPVKGHLIVVELKSRTSSSLGKRLNAIPTTLGLPKNEVELLINTGRELLRKNSQFRELVGDLSEI
ncbi:MAG: patatin-like phospholipase family protein [Gammaproteobacteria bacterium]|nr:patatin-like phospholipase family protein [Gammaproteobacteria bacterium]MCP5136381.1 patatin-like phospholipase family protein [Gammaproteobacteria bacterium]